MIKREASGFLFQAIEVGDMKGHYAWCRNAGSSTEHIIFLNPSTLDRIRKRVEDNKEDVDITPLGVVISVENKNHKFGQDDNYNSLHLIDDGKMAILLITDAEMAEASRDGAKYFNLETNGAFFE